MLIACERCPGGRVDPPACPTCVLQLLWERAPLPERDAGADLAHHDPSGRHAGGAVGVELLRRCDDRGAALDAREQRAVAILTNSGILRGADVAPRRPARRSA